MIIHKIKNPSTELWQLVTGTSCFLGTFRLPAHVVRRSSESWKCFVYTKSTETSLNAPAICRMEILFLMQTLFLSCFINIYCLELLNYVTDDRSKFSSRRRRFFRVEEGSDRKVGWSNLSSSSSMSLFRNSLASASLRSRENSASRFWTNFFTQLRQEYDSQEKRNSLLRSRRNKCAIILRKKTKQNV